MRPTGWCRLRLAGWAQLRPSEEPEAPAYSGDLPCSTPAGPPKLEHWLEGKRWCWNYSSAHTLSLTNTGGRGKWHEKVE